MGADVINFILYNMIIMAWDLREKLAKAWQDRGLDVPADFAELELDLPQEVDTEASGAEQAVRAFGETIRQLPDLDRMLVLKMLVEELSA